MSQRLSTSAVFRSLEARVLFLETNSASNNPESIINALGYTPVNKSGDIFAGILQVGDANFHMAKFSTYVENLYDAGDGLVYDRVGDNFLFYIANSITARIDVNGVFSARNISVGDASFGLLYDGGSQPQMIFDTGDKITYDRTANKFYFVIGGVNVASIDASGNLRIKGALSQGVTP